MIAGGLEEEAVKSCSTFSKYSLYSALPHRLFLLLGMRHGNASDSPMRVLKTDYDLIALLHSDRFKQSITSQYRTTRI